MLAEQVQRWLAPATLRATTEGGACHSDPLAGLGGRRASVVSGHVHRPAFAEENAVDFCLCRTAGVESEMELAYAGLQQLCRPLAGHSEELATLHRNVLDQVFGLTE